MLPDLSQDTLYYHYKLNCTIMYSAVFLLLINISKCFNIYVRMLIEARFTINYILIFNVPQINHVYLCSLSDGLAFFLNSITVNGNIHKLVARVEKFVSGHSNMPCIYGLKACRLDPVMLTGYNERGDLLEF